MTDQPLSIAVVIPSYNVEREVEAVVQSLPDWVTHVIAVEDASSDGTPEVLEALAGIHPHLTVLSHERNVGVGGAMVTGYRKALELGVDIVVKIDGDGQMDPKHLAALIQPIVEGRADYAKGNRFRHLADLAGMPKRRLLGNIALTFMTKFATGYWHIFDAQNGFLAITRVALESVPLDKVDRSYSFENSMLGLLNIESCTVIDVPLPAIYGDEQSSMSLARVIFSFPFRLLRMYLRRVFYKYLVYDVSPISLYLFFGTIFLTFAVGFGGTKWVDSIRTGVASPTGTVVLSLLTFLIGFTLLLQAVNLDIDSSPRPRAPRRQTTLDEIPGLFGPR